NDVLCVSVVTKRVERQCVSGLGRDGDLTLPFQGKDSARLYIQFGTMPLSQGNFFAVRDVLLFGGKPPHAPRPTGALDLRTGHASQTVCATPIGCRHAVEGSGKTLTVTTGEGKPGGRLTLDVPVPAELEMKPPRAVAFDYAIDQGGGTLAVTARVPGHN